MNLFVHKRECILAATWYIYPRIRKKLERAEEALNYCICEWMDGANFEVHMINEGMVNIGARTCTCDWWQLNGISCAHACVALYSDRRTLENYVDDCYCKAAYSASYEPTIHAMPGPDDWLHAGVDDTFLP